MSRRPLSVTQTGHALEIFGYVKTNLTPFGIKTTFDCRSENSKSCSILKSRFEQKGDYRGKGRAFVGVGSRALVASLGSKMTIDYPPKQSK